MTTEAIELSAIDKRIAQEVSTSEGTSAPEIEYRMSDPQQSAEFWKNLEDKIVKKAGVNNRIVALFDQKKIEEGIYGKDLAPKSKEEIFHAMFGKRPGEEHPKPSEDIGEVKKVEENLKIEKIEENVDDSLVAELVWATNRTKADIEKFWDDDTLISIVMQEAIVNLTKDHINLDARNEAFSALSKNQKFQRLVREKPVLAHIRAPFAKDFPSTSQEK